MHAMTYSGHFSGVCRCPHGFFVAALLMNFAAFGERSPAQVAPPSPADSSLASPAVPHDPGSAKIMVVARAVGDSVVLRWAPSTPHAWRLGNRIGYILEKQVEGAAPVRATPDTIRPWTIRRFVDAMNADTGNSSLGLALYSLAADTSLFGMADSLGLDTVGRNAALNTTLFGYALLAADNSPAVAEGLGLRFVDRDVRGGARIVYRIRLSSPREYRIDPGEVTVTAGSKREGPPPANLRAVGQDGRIVLTWDAGAGEFSGYFISRSDDGGKSERKLNQKPLVVVTPEDSRVRPAATYTDTTIVNYKTYTYRVRGMDSFGEMGEAAEVEASGRDLTPPPAPFVDNPEQLGREKIRLTWQMPATSPDVSGFVVDRSADPDSGFHRVSKAMLAPSVHEFVDESPTDAEPYYAVGSVDTAGNAAMSLPVYGYRVDTLPPAVPTGLGGTIDSNGVVHLRWHRGPENNLLGYRILRANAPDHEFEQLTGMVWKDTTFTDTVTLATLTEHVYYRIAAVNKRYNPSPMSPVLALRRPDIVAPVAPVFTEVVVTDTSAILHWVPSSSGDVRAHELYRRLRHATAWSLLAVLRPREASYVDNAVTQNTTYEYTIEAVDSSGLHSPAATPVQARPYDPGIRPLVHDLKGQYQETERRVLIQWNYAPLKQEKFFFLVFRSVGGGPLAPYRSFPSSQLSFTDDQLLGVGRYVYAVKVMTENGAESPLSGRVEVVVSAR